MPDPFISVQDLSDILGRDVTTDAGAVMAVDAACDIVRDHTEQLFNQVTNIESFDGTGTDCIVLPQRPALAAGTVTVNGGTVTDYQLSGHGLLLRGTANGFCGWLRPTWPRGRQNVKVVYESGYAVGDVPRSIRAVALMIAQRLVVQGVAQSETVGDVVVSYATAAGDLTPGEQRILAGYLTTRSF